MASPSRAQQEVAAEEAVALQVADDGLDGAAASPLAANGRGDAALLAGDEHTVSLGVVAAVAAVDIGALDCDAGDRLGLGDLGGQGVAVIGVARQGAGAEDELATGVRGVGGGDRDLHAELVARPGLALADALDLGCVQRVELVAILRLLGEETADPIQDQRDPRIALCLWARLARDVAPQAAGEGAHPAQMAQALGMAAGVEPAPTSRRARPASRRKDCRSAMPAFLAARFIHSIARCRRWLSVGWATALVATVVSTVTRSHLAR